MFKGSIKDEIIIEEKVEIQKVFRQVSEEAIDLRVVEKFFTEVERRMLMTSTSAFNIEIIKTALQKLRNLPSESSPMDFLQVDFQIKHEFQTWQKKLQKRDGKIETYHLRRFCDSTHEPLDNVVYSALARFYRNLDFSAANQSKFDLVITRHFASDRGQAHRTVRLSRNNLIEQIDQLFNRWDGKNNCSAQVSDKVAKVVAKINEFISEAESLTTFEELIKSNLFERFRNFKQNLGKNFFEPQVIAAAIECNLAVGNAFNNLLGNANENLGAKLTSAFDFAGAFHDTSPNAQIHISEILNEVKIHETLDRESPQYQELRHIWELLEHIGVENDLPFEINEPVRVAEISPTKSSLPPQIRLKSLLATLSEPTPDSKILREYMQKSETLKMLDLNDFINVKDENAGSLCREALSLIIWSEEIRENELNQPKNLPLTIRDEVKTILRKSQSLAEHLGLLIEISDDSAQNRLLVVSNKLLETSLKLERAIVRFSNRNLGISKPTPEAEKQETPPPIFLPDQVKSAVVHTSVNGWLIVGVLLMALSSGLIYYVTQQISNIVPAAQDVEKLNLQSLPDNKHLKAAIRKRTTLFVTAQDSWATLSKDEQSEILQNLSNHPTKIKIENVVVIDGTGKVFGEVSTDGVNTSENLQLADSKPFN